MQTSGKSLFASVIEDHLALKRKNAALEMSMPLDRFIPAIRSTTTRSSSPSTTPASRRKRRASTCDHARVERCVQDGELDDVWLDRQQCAEFNWGD